MKTTMVPPNPGNLSAFGLLAVDWRTDQMVTRVMHEEAIDLDAVAAIYETLEAQGRTALEKDGIPADKIALLREADVRYAGQSMEVRVPVPAGVVDARFVASLVEAFNAAHLKTFGYNYAGQQKIEVVNFCVSAFGLIDRPSIPALDKAIAAPEPTRRDVYFDGQFRDTPVFARGTLPAGFTLDGPAIVEEFGSTTVVFPGQKLAVDPHGILIICTAG
jgi:N-methylhydantoinase A